MGTSSCTLVVAWSSSSVTGSGRSADGSKVAWLPRGTATLASLPMARLSASLRCGRTGMGRSANRTPPSSSTMR